MRVVAAVFALWCRLSAAARVRAARLPDGCRPEFSLVNQRSGLTPLQPELSGLRLRPARVPQRAGRLLIALAYRWQPSREYHRRQDETRQANGTVDPKPLPLSPPVLLFPAVQDVAPHRFQPLIDPGHADPAGRNLPCDLTDLAAREQARAARVLRPRLAETDATYLAEIRPLLPRRVRGFLHDSPYPRLAVVLAAGVGTLAGILWFSQLQQAEARATGRLHVARGRFTRDLSAASAYGVDPRLLRPLEWAARRLEAQALPGDFVVDRTRIRSLGNQARAFDRLHRSLLRLERQAAAFWTHRQGITYAAQVDAYQQTIAAGLPARRPMFPACGIPHCLRRVVAAELAATHRLLVRVRRVQAARATLLRAPNPALAAGTALQQAHSITALLPHPAVPLDLTALDQQFARARGASGEIHAGALAVIDLDALQQQLRAGFHGQTVVVSLQSQTLTAYVHQKPAFTAPVTTGVSTPSGRFVLGPGTSSLAATFWLRNGAAYRYQNGVIADWLPFQGADAFQAAPWRTAFGVGSAGAVSGFAPDTPGSIDLPPIAAEQLFAWARPGATVVIY